MYCFFEDSSSRQQQISILGWEIRVAIHQGHVRKISFRSWTLLEILGEEILITWPVSRLSMNFVEIQGQMRAFFLNCEPCRNTVSIKLYFSLLKIEFQNKKVYFVSKNYSY